MALDDYKIAGADYAGKDISGLSNRPAMTAAQLKARFDALVKNVVAVKLNGLINELKTALAALASKVTGATSGNFAGLDASGQITDSGKKAADFEAAGAITAHNDSLSAHGGIPARHQFYQASGSAWYKILSYPTNQSSCVRITAYTSSGYLEGRGNWELIVTYSTAAGTTPKAILIYATNGIDISDVDVRYGGDTIKVYYNVPPQSFHKFVSEWIIGPVTLTTHDVKEEPSGTVAPISYAQLGIGNTANLPVFTGADGVLGTKSAAAARTALGLGNSATKNVGTGAANVSAGNHTHSPASIGASASNHTHSIAGLRDLYVFSKLIDVEGGERTGTASTGLSSSYKYIACGQNISPGGIYPVGAVAYEGGVTVYFNETSPYTDNYTITLIAFTV